MERNAVAFEILAWRAGGRNLVTGFCVWLIVLTRGYLARRSSCSSAVPERNGTILRVAAAAGGRRGGWVLVEGVGAGVDALAVNRLLMTTGSG
jgi:hypothetical protein